MAWTLLPRSARPGEPPAAEQLALDLGVHRRRSRWWGRWSTWRPVLRVLVSLVLAVVLAGVAVSVMQWHSTVGGVPVRATGSVGWAHRGLSIDSTLGDLEFPRVTGLPVGLHVTPVVDLDVVRQATSTTGFARQLREDVRAQAPDLVKDFTLAAVAGLVTGALVGGLLFDGLLLLLAPSTAARSPSRRRRLTEAGLRVVGVTVATGLVVTSWAAMSYDPSFVRRYTVTGLLADLAATPDRLAALDARDSDAADKIRAVLRLQDALTAAPATLRTPDPAYRVLFISDVHRRNIYPYLQQYVTANDVALIVDTGDETLVGNSAELTPDYTASIAAVTSRTPMIWVKGNHDSAAIAAGMAAIPGVTVLDGQVVTADGLQVYGTADPRTYGAPGAAGSDDPATVTKLETSAAGKALKGVRRSTYLDLLLAHEPVEADALAQALGPTVRLQASGHVHHQNPESDLQVKGRSAIRLVEGSTGLGGLLADGSDPMQFSILTVAGDCQFTRLVRYTLADPALPTAGQAVSYGDSSSFVVHYFDPQPIASSRRCSRDTGVGTPVPATSRAPRTLAQWGAGAASPPPAVVATPSPVSAGDEAPDGAVADPVPTGSATPAP